MGLESDVVERKVRSCLAGLGCLGMHRDIGIGEVVQPVADDCLNIDCIKEVQVVLVVPLVAMP